MVEEYRKFAAIMPMFSSEVAHRVVELVKVFNSRSCQLVLGAGAMQVSGLKSITAKHLALSCQCLGFLIQLQPVLRDAFAGGMAEHRKALLAPEMGRLLSDLTVHRDEIHAKLVAIMRERLLAGTRALPLSAEKWGAGAAAPARRPRATTFAEGTAKQLRVLSGVLVPLMTPEDLGTVFGRISILFAATLAESYARLEPRGEAWEAQRKADAMLLLETLMELPVGLRELKDNLKPLMLFCQKYGKLKEFPQERKGKPSKASASSLPLPPPPAMPASPTSRAATPAGSKAPDLVAITQAEAESSLSAAAEAVASAAAVPLAVERTEVDDGQAEPPLSPQGAEVPPPGALPEEEAPRPVEERPKGAATTAPSDAEDNSGDVAESDAPRPDMRNSQATGLCAQGEEEEEEEEMGDEEEVGGDKVEGAGDLAPKRLFEDASSKSDGAMDEELEPGAIDAEVAPEPAPLQEEVGSSVEGMEK